MSWLNELEGALAKEGVPAAQRRRIIAELADHLDSDPDSEQRLGSPAALARLFAGAYRVKVGARRRALSASLVAGAALLVSLWIVDTYISTPSAWAAITCAKRCTPVVVEHLRQTGPWRERLLSDSLWAIPLAVGVAACGLAVALLIYRPRRSFAVLPPTR